MSRLKKHGLFLIIQLSEYTKRGKLLQSYPINYRTMQRKRSVYSVSLKSWHCHCEERPCPVLGSDVAIQISYRLFRHFIPRNDYQKYPVCFYVQFQSDYSIG